MLDRNISGLSVIDGTGAVVGFIPELSHAQLLEQNVMSIATNKVATINLDASIAEVCQKFGYQQYKKLPVVENGKLVGVVNRGRLTRRSFETCLEG